MTQPSPRPIGQLGIGLVEAMLAASIGIVVLLAMARMASSTFQSARKIDSSADISALKVTIANGVDSATSFAPAAPICSPGSYVDLKAKDDSVVVSSAGTAFGP